MINDVGKTAAIIRLNDYTINMVNSTIDDLMTNGIQIYDEDNLTLRYAMSIDSANVNSRCLMFFRSFSGSAIDIVKRPVLYLPSIVQDAGAGNVTCIPLYECMSPSCAVLVNGNYQLTWWTNFDNTPDMDLNGKYIYDYAKVHKFKTNELGDIDDNVSACKVLCTAPIHWEKLRMGDYDVFPQNTPIIRDIAIIACIQGEGYIVDFSTGGGSSGGGLKIHSHLNTQDGGFAAAVFMPSATPRVMSWM